MLLRKNFRILVRLVEWRGVDRNSWGDDDVFGWILEMWVWRGRCWVGVLELFERGY